MINGTYGFPIVRFWIDMVKSTRENGWAESLIVFGAVLLVLALTAWITYRRYSKESKVVQTVIFGAFAFLWVACEVVGYFYGGEGYGYFIGTLWSGLFLTLAAGMAIGWLVRYIASRRRKTKGGDM